MGTGLRECGGIEISIRRRPLIKIIEAHLLILRMTRLRRRRLEEVLGFSIRRQGVAQDLIVVDERETHQVVPSRSSKKRRAKLLEKRKKLRKRPYHTEAATWYREALAASWKMSQLMGL